MRSVYGRILRTSAFYNCCPCTVICGKPLKYVRQLSIRATYLQHVCKMHTFGQPVYVTHPHLVSKREITPKVTKDEYMERRHKFIVALESYAKSAGHPNAYMVVIPSASKQYMSDKIPYVFRQNSDFLYLTGCQEPDSCLVLTRNHESHKQTVLFVRNKDDHSELWDGPRTGPKNVCDLFGVDSGVNVEELELFLNAFTRNNQPFALWYDYANVIQAEVHAIMMNYFDSPGHTQCESPKSFIHQLRLIKSTAEISLMQQSCDIASDAIMSTIKFSRPGVTEHQLFAKVDYECRMRGAEFLAYPPVVAGGNRANIIHYINNNQIIADKELVLMDAGCEYHGYASDITRTWPVNGSFTSEQKEIYEVVLDLQVKLIKYCSRLPSLDQLFEVMCNLLGENLQEIGLIPKRLSRQDLTQAAYKFCPHHVSHYLGMDVHDTSLIGRKFNLQPGMVITVEPGIYINLKRKDVPEPYRGIGVRIEDDVLISENGPIVLSRRCPKSIDEIEELSKSSTS